MQITINNYDPNSTADCIILPVYQTEHQALITTEFNANNNNIINELLNNNDISGKLNEENWLYNITPNIKRVLTIGVGDPAKLTNSGYINILTTALNKLVDKQLTNVINGLLDINLKNQTLDWKINQIIQVSTSFDNRVDTYQSKQLPKLNIQNYSISSSDKSLAQFTANSKESISSNQILAKAVKTAKNLANMPPNLCNPEYFRQQSLELARNHKSLSCTIQDHDELDKMGMGAFCAVSRGSAQPGCLITFEYNGGSNKSDAPYVLIGKGITFDTGGYTLKPAKAMLGMKYDMCGAASVFATMQAICELNLPINVVGILACAENMIGHKSTRPDDIVTSLNGKTIEINNTDAEGRLVLCDAISYSEKFKPKVIIDIATLTGAAVVALGYQYSAVYTNNNDLEKDLLSASDNTYDPVWPMPLCQDYNELLNSPIADLQNSSSMPVAGSITAACFLSNFVPENTNWAHIDIAGTATAKADNKLATGRPVPLLVNYLINQADNN